MNAMKHFPPGYTPRPQQIEMVERIDEAFDSGKKTVVVEAPTGSGKTHVGMTFARQERDENEKGTFFLSSLKTLQDQYLQLFPEPELVTLKGRNAYSCDLPEGKAMQLTADDGICRRQAMSILTDCIQGDIKPHAFFQGQAPPSATICPYWKQLQKAAQSPISLFNLHSFLFQKRLRRFGRRSLMIVDEAHRLEESILGFVDTRLWEGDLKKVQVFVDEKCKTGEDVKEWISEADVIRQLQKKIEEIKPTDGAEVPERLRRDLDTLENLAFKIDLLMTLIPKSEQWAVSIEEGKLGRRKGDKCLVCRPVYARNFAADLFFGQAERTLAMSATILDHELWATSLGLKIEDVAFVQMPSAFPKANRPVVIDYAGPMSYSRQEGTFPRMVDKIREILNRHKDERGIIHCHSFFLGRRLVTALQNPRLLMVDEEQDKTMVIAKHAQTPGSVLVSPGMTEGVDLKDDLARFAILPKVPFASTQDLVIGLRMADQKGWYDWRTCLTFLQACGRTVRHDQDHATTYLVDSDFEGFMSRTRKLLPDWWKESIVRTPRTAVSR
jgi:Rad3-related DNA helicase